MLDDTRAEQGVIARDFGLPIRTDKLVLSIVGRQLTTHAGLFFDSTIVAGPKYSDAFLINSRQVARRYNKPLLRMSRGFLHTPPIQGQPGMIYSATLSRISATHAHRWPELILARRDWLTQELSCRAEAILSQVITARTGGACWGAVPRQPVTAWRAVIFAAADPNATRSMLLQTLQQHAASRIVLIMRRPGQIGVAAKRLGVAVLDGNVDPWPLIERCDCVHAPAGSETAFIAALLGKPVECVGHGPLSFTRDKLSLVAAVLMLGSRYVDPFTGHSTTCERFLDVVSEMRRRHDANNSIACCVGISFWKRRRVAVMLGASKPPAFRKTAAAAVGVAAERGGAVVVWPSRAPAALNTLAAAAGIPVSRLEDGFVRSIGLGADFLPPLSLVLDRLGIYYDATRPSDLELLLSEQTFDQALLRRAAALRRRIVRDRVTKYNLPSSRSVVVPPASRVILVPGQVADDRSVLLGGGGVKPGLDLLHRVRLQAPEAHIIYKPHPDVDAGHRHGAVPDGDALALADQVIRGGSMADLLATVHEVHTLTSLAGFEALMREKPVTTYGQPFYAGWGLTTDLNPPARRTRQLRLDELVAGTMILYPRYIDPVTLLACGPEIVLDRLRDPALHRASLLVMARRAQGRWIGGRVRRAAERMEAA